MNAVLWPVFEYVAKHKWLQWVLLCVTGLIIIRVWMYFHDENVRKFAKQKQIEVSLKEQAEVSETRRQKTQENIDAANRADEAVASLPGYVPSELRKQNPGLAAIVLGADRGGDDPAKAD